MMMTVFREMDPVLCHTTNHEAQRTGVDVGMIHTAVHFIGIVPVCRALVFVTEPLCF